MLDRRLRNLSLLAIFLIVSGCASVPTASLDEDTLRKSFSAPTTSMSAIYIYRDSNYGAALKKSVSVDNIPLGQTAPKTYFYIEVAPGEHTLATESEFGDQTLTIETEAGEIYFVKQYIKMGLMIGGSNLKLVDETEGEKGVLKCRLAENPYL